MFALLRPPSHFIRMNQEFEDCLMKVMTIVGTRPEIIKLSRVIVELDRHFDHVLVHSGQNYDYELNEVFFDEMRLKKPDHFLNAVGASVAETIGLIIARADAVMAFDGTDVYVDRRRLTFVRYIRHAMRSGGFVDFVPGTFGGTRYTDRASLARAKSSRRLVSPPPPPCDPPTPEHPPF